MSHSKSSSHDSALRIVLLGQTGTGKSATGNTILGRTEFKSDLRSQPVTTKCERKEAVIFERSVTVIDTPDFFSESCTDLQAHISECMTLAAPAPHAFLLVLQLGQFTEGEKEIVKKIQKAFGEEVTKRTIVLFTHGDELENQNIKTFVAKASPDLQHLIYQCGGRFHLFKNNKTKTKHKQVMKLFCKIDKMSSKTEKADRKGVKRKQTKGRENTTFSPSHFK